MARVLCLLPFGLLFLSCVDGPGVGPGGPGDELGVVILESAIPDAGPDAGPPDAGLLPDAGFVEYEGAPEEGVRCGGALDPCAAGAACCVDTTQFPVPATCSPTGDLVCGEGITTQLNCDGAEDCAEAEACCLGGDIVSGLTTTCGALADCVADQGAPVCTATADCPGGLVCCGLSGIPLPVDLGVCSPSCDAAGF